MAVQNLVGVVAAMGCFVGFEHFARRARRIGSHDENPGPIAFRLLTIVAVIGCFAWGPPRAVAVGLTLGLMTLSQTAMWLVTMRTGNSIRGATLESLGMLSALVVAFATRAFTSPAA